MDKAKINGDVPGRLAVLAPLLLILCTCIAWSNLSQDFETWPTTTSWGTTQHEEWTLTDGQVKLNRGGFAPPIDFRCGWLHDFDDSTNSCLQSPLFTNGVLSVRLWTRHDTSSGGSSSAVLQRSTNDINWVQIDAFTIVDGAWTQHTFTINSPLPTRLRIRKTSDTAANAYAGIDNIEAFDETTTTTSSTSTTSSSSSTSSPISYGSAEVFYPLEAYGGTGTDTVMDASGNGQDGIADTGVFSAGQPIAGINGNSAVFPGDSDIYVAGESPPSGSRFRNETLDLGTSDYTIAMWVRATGAYSGATGPNALVFVVIDSVFNHPALYLNKGGTISYEVLQDNATMSSTFNSYVPVDSQWHHVAVVVNRDNLGSNPSAIYLDSVNVTGADVMENTFNSLMPGPNEFWRWGFSLNGQGDDFAIFSQALSQAQIVALSGATSTTSTTSSTTFSSTSSTSSTSTDSTTSSTTTLPAIVRGPYLQLNTPTNMTIRWRTNVPTESHVAFGATLNSLNESVIDTNLTVDHEVTVTGLVAEAKYYYATGTTFTNLAGNDINHYFRTAPLSGEANPTRIWVLGDSGTANANAEAVRDAYGTFAGTNITDLWLMLGDNAYLQGTDAQYEAAVFEMYPAMLRNTALWSTLGNHDGMSADSETQTGPYYDIYSLPSSGQAGGLASGTEAYYSFDHANIHFVCLDSYDTDRATNGTMMTWLRNDLSTTMQDWIIAFWHHPPYSKGSHDSDSEFQPLLVEMRENALPILEEAGVDLVLCGHSHSYERSYYINGHYDKSWMLNTNTMIIDAGDGRPGGDGPYTRQSTTGAVYVVAGSSGQTSGGALNHPVMFFSLRQLGSLVLDINGDILQARFIDYQGVVRDNFAIVKPAEDLAIEYFAWGPINLTNSLGIPFAVSLTAKSSNDATVVNFSGEANLKGLIREEHREVSIGAGSLPWIYPMSTLFNDARTQIIYLTNEIGSVSSITGMAVNVSTIPGQTMNIWTIRMKHTDLSNFTSTPSWDGDGWTVLYQTNEPPGATGWRSFFFTSPFAYNAASNLMVDFSFNNSSFSTDGHVLSTLLGSRRSIVFRTDNNLGDPLTWSGSNPAPAADFRIANIRLFTKTDERILSIAPTNVAGFVFGQWTGAVTVFEETTNMTIMADDGQGHQGDANTFSILPIAPMGTPFLWLLSHGLTNSGYDVEELIDVDGDFMVAWEEFIADTDPTDADSVLALIAVNRTNGDVQVHWQGGVLARQYLQRREGLESGIENWLDLFTNEPPTTTSTNFTHSISTNDTFFYRIKAERP
jgi:hypothetical protein